MRTSGKLSSLSSTTTSTTATTIRYTHKNEQSVGAEQQHAATTSSATKIQSAYKAHKIRMLYRKIWRVNSEAERLECEIQRQETVDAMRGDEKARVMMNEAAMRLLLELDSVPGVDEAVREARRKVSRRIVGIQEIMDAICDATIGYEYGDCRESPWWSWREFDEMEEEICRERGGDDLENFCAQYLGFRCLHRFLRD